ncbi:MAG TPA: DUF2520 domain-containing protein [Candidatus Limnocylindrales bacterium]|nr:DUF2520 domain-containing protein [Candidatus Limnocylindrales bacterium]
MKAWDQGDVVLREARERREAQLEATAAELEAHGIDLDPLPPGHHRHGDEVHAHDHEHPHARSEPGEHPVVGVVGAGPVGTTLGLAFSRAGWPVAAVASRDAGRREAFRRLVPGARGFAEPNALVDDVEIVFLTVPDDAIAAVAGSLRLYAGQAVVHTSGLLGPEVLAPAMAAGTQAATFHPLVAFADPMLAVDALQGATVAIEGDEGLAAHLAELAEAIGAVPVRLPPGSKATYHAAAVLSAGGVVSLLDAIVELGRTLELDETATLAIFLPLVEQTAANVRALGVARALTGPTVRGDAGTVTAHLDAIARSAPGVEAVYRALVERSVAIAEDRRALAPDAAQRLRTALARPG